MIAPHVFTTTSNSVYICTLCDEDFNVWGELKIHHKKEHDINLDFEPEDELDETTEIPE